MTLPDYSNKMMMMMLVSFDIGHVYKHDDDDDEMMVIGKYKQSQSYTPL